jgi:hypothetical protein
VYDKNICCIIEYCKKLLYDEMLLEFNTNVKKYPKLRTYRTFKEHVKTKPYLFNRINKAKRSIFAQYRMGVLPLNIEVSCFKIKKCKNTGVMRRLRVDMNM